MKNILYQRKIDGISAILLPFQADGTPDYNGFLAHLDRTYTAGLTPAINMDTGYANLLTREQRLTILELLSKAILVTWSRSTPAKRTPSNSAAARPSCSNPLHSHRFLMES